MERFDRAYVASDCAVGTQYVGGFERYTRTSHELRVQSSSDKRIRWMAGAFYQSQEHDFDLQWIVPDLDPALTVVLPPTGDRKYGGNTVWQTYQIREDQDTAFFGELSFDFSDQITGTFGARYFEFDNSLYGFNGFARHCTGQYVYGVFDERSEIDISDPGYGTGIPGYVPPGTAWTTMTNRPRSYSIRFSQRF